jgi:hypothetical protein
LSLAVFVNTSDGYKDCWAPFFTLFERYAKGLRNCPIYLNTERESFRWPGLHLHPTAAWALGRAERPGWGERCAAGLHMVAEQYVLYLQEDYFMTCEVREDIFERALDQIESDKSVGVVYLNDRGPRYRSSRCYSPGFVEILPPAGYLVNTQAAVWRKDFLLSLLKPWENVWMFEKFATLRARCAQERFLAVSPEVLAESPVFDYGFTGIARGRWQTECVPLFEREHIKVDFSKRGFYGPRGPVKVRMEVLSRIFASPTGAMRSFLTLL